ncbi:hypothetical protein B5K06_06235 [Rhizobium grahamii]|uniref:Uncharacterized protein n=1 Tax=Rhizobium grahamii TaxID=1120045 RepID=A0A370KU43_9HYPH|nr:hypothetical protein B5K06_06235 [Rhizobium grahamii]
MDLNWVVLWSTFQDRNRKIHRDRFSDPLEGPEWQNLQLIVRLFVWRAARRSAVRKAALLRVKCENSRTPVTLRNSAARRDAGIPG